MFVSVIHSLELDGNAFIATESHCVHTILCSRRVTMRANVQTKTGWILTQRYTWRNEKITNFLSFAVELLSQSKQSHIFDVNFQGTIKFWPGNDFSSAVFALVPCTFVRSAWKIHFWNSQQWLHWLHCVYAWTVESLNEFNANDLFEFRRECNQNEEANDLRTTMKHKNRLKWTKTGMRHANFFFCFRMLLCWKFDVNAVAIINRCGFLAR